MVPSPGTAGGMGHGEQLGWGTEERWEGRLGEAERHCRHHAKLVPTPQRLRFALRKENPDPDAPFLHPPACTGPGCSLRQRRRKTLRNHRDEDFHDVRGPDGQMGPLRPPHQPCRKPAHGIPPSEWCQRTQAGGGSRASALWVTPLFKTQSPSAL